MNNNEKLIIKNYLNTSDVGRYSINFINQFLIYSDKEAKSKIQNNEYPNLKKHLDFFKRFITSSNKPYGIHRPRKEKYFKRPKLICKGMFAKPEFYYDEDKYYVGFSFSVIINRDNNYKLKYLLGLMNSKVGEYWFKTNGKKRGIGVDIGVKVFRKFPIPKISFSNKKEKSQHDKLVSLVAQIIESQKNYHSAKSENSKKVYKQKIEILDNQINKIVYQLYDITKDEIEIIEKSF